MSPNQLLTALAADESGNVFDLDGYASVGMAGNQLVLLEKSATIALPHGSELMLMPDRPLIVFELKSRKMTTISENPHDPRKRIFPVAAFVSPGHVLTCTAAYEDLFGAAPLPLFSYGAAGWGGAGFRCAAEKVDNEPRQDLRLMPVEKVKAGVHRIRKELPENRLARHLETCALTYGCPAGKNFFLGRYEAPLPTATACNARCLGCLSHQKTDGDIPVSQNRITFTPTPDEIAEVALAHICRVKNAVVSFGQGCEGDPLLAADVIEPAIRMIRRKTPKGTIHMNTNASRPDRLAKLLDAGLDSIRISLNSVRKSFYHAYFRPKGYGFEHVIESMDLALSKNRFVSINYLNLPGFTDTEKESDAVNKFIVRHPVHMIQWRNLNYDPLRYLGAMKRIGDSGNSLGVGKLLASMRKTRPDIRYGYFNPPKEKW